MYGGGTWAIRRETVPSIERWPIPTAGGRDGAVSTKHRFISAVLALGERRDAGELFDAPKRSRETQPYVHVVDAWSPEAVLVPANVFDGHSDARWSPDRDQRYRQLSGSLRPGSVPDSDA
jgi:hypothetical protein